MARGTGNMQLWQQQLMYKQSQELHRQQQLQQLDQGPWQLSPLSQLSGVTNPATGNQLSTPLYEMPINDTYNCMWPNNFVGGISNLPSNTQMFIAGNRNLMQPSSSAAMQNFANDVITSNDQSQAMQSMGFVPQEINQSFNGMPVSGTSSVNQYSRFLGMSNNCHDLMTKANAYEAEKASYPYSTAQSYQQSAAQSCLQDKTLSVQNYPGKHIFGNSLLRNLGNDVNDVSSGNFQQANNIRYSDQFDEFHGRQEQGDSSGNLQEKPVSEVGSSSGVASLDPIEQKILFGSDNDNWGFSFGGSLISGMGEDIHGHTLENDHYGSFPSIHSGSWSALMQEAVQASSSDKGLREERSGLCFQKTEQVMGKPSVPINVNRKQPTAWDDSNLQSVTSVTSRSFPLFNDANATPNSSTSPSNQNFSEFAHEENDRILTEASQVSFRLSTQGANNKEFCQNQDQTKLVEDGLLPPRPSSSGLWVGKTIEQHEEIQFKLKDIGGRWGDQQNLPLSDAPSGWNSSYPTASRSNKTLNYQENHGNLWKIGENRVYLNSGLQSVKSDISSPKIAEYSLASNYGSVRNPNALKLNQNKHQQVTNEQKSVFGIHFAPNTCMSSEGDKDVEENQNQPSRSPQGWPTSLNATSERLCNTHENEKENGRVDSGKGYIEDAAKEKSLWTSNDQYPFMSGSQKSSIQYGQHTVGSRMLQNSLGKMRTAEPSFPPNHLLSLQNRSSSNSEQPFAETSQFSGHIVCNDHMDGSKRIAVETGNLLSRNTIPVYASSNSFNGSTIQYSQIETIAQASKNVLELLHKVDQSGNGNSVNSSDIPAQAVADFSVTHAHFDGSSNIKGIGLQLTPPSVPMSHKSFSDINSAQLDNNARYQNQGWSNFTSSARSVLALDDPSKIDKWDKMSSLPGQKLNEHPETNQHFDYSASADFPLTGNQLQEQQQLQQQHSSSAKDHLEHQQQQWQQQHISNTTSCQVLDQSVKFSFGNQVNARAFVKSASLTEQLHDSNDGSASGKSVQTSFPSLVGTLPTPGIVSAAENHVPVGSRFCSVNTDQIKPTFAGFSQITNSGEQLPVVETKSGSQSSLSGLSQQDGFSKMFHNVWTSISVQQRQAGISPLLTPNALQFIINHDRDTSLLGLPKVGDQVDKEESTPEVGSSSVNLQKGEVNPAQGKSVNLIQTEKVDVIPKSENASHSIEELRKPPLDAVPNVSISSLLCLHKEQDPPLSSQVLHSPPASIVSSSGDLDISGCVLKPPDIQQQKYSLLHQIQSMKASDSDLNKITGNVPRGTAFSSNTSQLNFNMDQGFDHRQNAVYRFSADGKVGAASQILFPSDAKMLSSDSSYIKDKNPSTSIAGWPELHTHTHPLGANSTANVLGRSEHTWASPHMAPFWFEHYGTYKNGRMVALCDAQRSGKTAIQQPFVQKFPARMDDSDVVEQKLDSSHGSSYGQGTSAIKTDPSRSSPFLLAQNVMDHDIILRSKKRKSEITDMPWHKIITVCPERSQSIRMTELDWTMSATRLMEKMDDEAETMEVDLLMPQSRRRLILTTQLMHQLIPAVPAMLFEGEATSDMPWHKIITVCPERSQSIRMTELDWTMSATRLMEKMDDEAETMEVDLLMPQSRRRLILTTQLMHQLIPAVPAMLFEGEATSAYASVIYSVAKAALSDACSLVSFSESDSHVLLGNENMIFGELRTSQKVEDNTFSKFAENFIGKSKKLKTDFIRLEKGSTLLDLRLECQELERFSILNHLGKFHGRTQANGVIFFPKRNITPLPVPGNLPEGVLCLSL
ncbi:hypothetical protein C4D60_Mb06t28390 [Musa balbisiana]|uniref:Uncharacterized protein n=1 Tax=Musa balbisiana TaxID=52838 RepID=A0A4S8IRB7_MUSBA|nr:hypothetical protein C4D60_Mb06t28390 [Musa balbisiana]